MGVTPTTCLTYMSLIESSISKHLSKEEVGTNERRASRRSLPSWSMAPELGKMITAPTTSIDCPAHWRSQDNSLLSQLAAERRQRKGEAAVLAACFRTPTPSPYSVKPLLVLDLDGTLLDTAPSGIRRGKPSFTTSLGRDAPATETRLRPGLADFLEAVRKDFDLAVFTAASYSYAMTMIEGINAVEPGFSDALCCVFSRDEAIITCEAGRTTVTKSLQRLATHCGRPLRRCLIVDDTPATYRRNPSNALPVPSYTGAEDDVVLDHLADFLCAMPKDGVPLDVTGYALAPPSATPLLTERVDGRMLGG